MVLGNGVDVTSLRIPTATEKVPPRMSYPIVRNFVPQEGSERQSVRNVKCRPEKQGAEVYSRGFMIDPNAVHQLVLEGRHTEFVGEDVGMNSKLQRRLVD